MGAPVLAYIHGYFVYSRSDRPFPPDPALTRTASRAVQCSWAPVENGYLAGAKSGIVQRLRALRSVFDAPKRIEPPPKNSGGSESIKPTA